MANLVSRLDIKQVAWNFGGSTRVFKVPELTVIAQEEKYPYRTAAGTYGFDFKGLWLSFIVKTDYFKEQVSGTACDRIDILNALVGSGTIFYPDYESQPLVGYTVGSGDQSTIQLLQTKQSLFKPAQVINMNAVSRISAYPDWLKYK